MLPLDDPDGLSAQLGQQALTRLRSIKTLHDAIAGGLTVADVVVQDEFTHDVIVPIGDLWAVYDST